MIISLALLGAGIVAYGLAGAQLTTGSRAQGGALRSSAWWLGTAWPCSVSGSAGSN